MKTDYIKQNESNKSATRFILRILAAALVLIFMILIRIAYRSDPTEAFFKTAAASDDIYEIAKKFMLPNTNVGEVTFAEDGYQFGRKSDSVYVVRSYYKIKNSTDTSKKYFKMTLRYRGGGNLNVKNWSVLSIEKE